MRSPPATQPHTSVPCREKGHCAGREHRAREEAAWPGHSRQPAAGGVLSPGHPWMRLEGNSAAGSSPHTSVTAATLHLNLSLSPFPMCKMMVCRKRGPSSPQGEVTLHQAGRSGVVGWATASCGFCAPTGLELFRFRGKCSKLGYAFLLL